ncbi:energy transducer TonB [Qipengyuania vesicularis]|uniref:energy transducer TonB n=1 Tax=Qipengyuania vesicularis TaxID=2867232 RepID=UPI001C8876AD|nr:energy transducer TonB [Qipengyuania vesicularis]MBX7526196.1 energy transducer TonB [Qipengyuania vesicularis]
MSYVDQNRGPSAAGLASSIIVQAAIGATIIAGLSVTQLVAPPKPDDPPIIEFEKEIPPKPPEPVEKAQDAKPEKTTVHVPDIPIDIYVDRTPIEVDIELPPPAPPSPDIWPKADPGPPAPVATFDPVSAKPRNDPGAWLRDSDYRPTWVRREYTGVARFRLDISATGQVTGCRILGSTGHTDLDEATCKLVQRRAKFQPARGGNGEPVAGSYTSSVRWQLPE